MPSPLNALVFVVDGFHPNGACPDVLVIIGWEKYRQHPVVDDVVVAEEVRISVDGVPVGKGSYIGISDAVHCWGKIDGERSDSDNLGIKGQNIVLFRNKCKVIIAFGIDDICHAADVLFVIVQGVALGKLCAECKCGGVVHLAFCRRIIRGVGLFRCCMQRQSGKAGNTAFRDADCRSQHCQYCCTRNDLFFHLFPLSWYIGHDM